MKVWVVVQFTDHDCGGEYVGVYAVERSECAAKRRVDAAPKAKSIVEGYRYEIEEADA